MFGKYIEFWMMAFQGLEAKKRTKPIKILRSLGLIFPIFNTWCLSSPGSRTLKSCMALTWLTTWKPCFTRIWNDACPAQQVWQGEQVHGEPCLSILVGPSGCRNGLTDSGNFLTFPEVPSCSPYLCACTRGLGKDDHEPSTWLTIQPVAKSMLSP